MIGAQARSGVPDHPLDDGVESQLDAIRMLERCEQSVARECGEVSRSIFQLRYGTLRSTRFIASLVGKSEDAVKASLRRFRLAIARRAGELGDGRSPTADAIRAPGMRSRVRLLTSTVRSRTRKSGSGTPLANRRRGYDSCL